MSSRLRIRKKSTRIETPDISTAPAQGMFQSRPFVVETHSAEKSQQQPDLKTALMRAQRYGHHLGRMQPAGLEAPTAVQRKTKEQSSKTHHPGVAIQTSLNSPVIQRARGASLTEDHKEVAQLTLRFLNEINPKNRQKLANRIESKRLVLERNPLVAAKRLFRKLERLESLKPDQQTELRNLASEVLAEWHEGQDAGHSLDRHGPDVSDDLLKRRLKTGVAPDSAEAPAPDYSTKFLNHEVWLSTRTAAQEFLQDRITRTQVQLLNLLPNYDKAKQEKDDALQAMKKNGLTSEEKQKLATKLTEAKNQEKAAKDSITSINEGLPFNTVPSIATADMVVLRDYYTVTIDAGKNIGGGFEGINEKAKATAMTEAHAAGRNKVHNKLATDQAKLYSNTQPVANLTKSTTGIKPAANAMPLVTGENGVYQPVAFNVADWQLVQHFPAAPNAVVGIT